MLENLIEANLAARFKPILTITLSEAIAINDFIPKTNEPNNEFNYNSIN